MEQKTGQRRRSDLFFCLAVFAAMLVFFTVLHPIPIMDEDDVIYTVLSRKAIPIPGAWNPSRMMPEVLSALCGNIAGLCTALKLGRFINCQVAVLGIMLALFITGYAYSLLRLLEKRFEAGRFAALSLVILFLELHFLIFRTEYSRNLYMFHTYDQCCVFYYTMPALLCCALVMQFMANPEWTPRLTGKQPLRESMLVLVLYFAVFSNLFGSAVLASYVLCRTIRDGLRAKKTGTGFQTFLKDEAVWLVVLLLWMIAAILESTGGRAGGKPQAVAAGAVGLPEGLRQAVGVLFQMFGKTALLFRLLMLAAVLAAAAVYLAEKDSRKKKALRQTLGGILAWSVPNGLFLILLCAVVSPGYAGRPEAMFTLLSAGMLLMILGFAALVRRFPRTGLLLPILLVFVFSMTNTRFLTFADSNPLDLDGHLAMAVENEIYESIIRAAEAGETEVTVRVPLSGEETNWPHDGNVGNPIAQFFLKYGIIDHEITVRIQPSEEFNREFHIPLPDAE